MEAMPIFCSRPRGGATGRWLVTVGAALSVAVALDAQSRRIEQAVVRCPSELGMGIETGRIYCDVVVGDEVAEGVIVEIPAHRGAATVTFTLHGRHTYSQDEMTRGRGYARYLAETVVATSEEVLSRPVVLAEFRNVDDLVDRIAGGAGPGGAKAVAPVGSEGIVVTVPESVAEISIVGIALEVQRVDGRETVASPGRPIALISNVQVEYRPR